MGGLSNTGRGLFVFRWPSRFTLRRFEPTRLEEKTFFWRQRRREFEAIFTHRLVMRKTRGVRERKKNWMVRLEGSVEPTLWFLSSPVRRRLQSRHSKSIVLLNFLLKVLRRNVSHLQPRCVSLRRQFRSSSMSILLIQRFQAVHQDVGHLETLVQRVVATRFVFLHARTKFRKIEPLIGQGFRRDRLMDPGHRRRLGKITFLHLIRRVTSFDVSPFHH